MMNLTSYEDTLLQNLEGKRSGSIPIGGIEFESQEDLSRYLICVFPELVKEGRFVQETERVPGNGSFNRFPRLFDKFSKWLVKRAEQKAAGKEQTVPEHIPDPAA